MNVEEATTHARGVNRRRCSAIGRPPAKQRGFLLVVAVVLIVVLALLVTSLASITVVGGTSSAEQSVSGQALFLAEAGLEYGQRQLAQNVDWYRDSSDPVITNGACPPSTITQNFGQGTFSVCSNLPATMLRRNLSNSATEICAYTIDRFPTNGRLQIDDDLAANGEFVSYTGTTSSLAACGNAPAFTGVARGVTVGSVATAAVAHSRSDHVYPVTTLVSAITSATCTTIPNPFQITDNSKFLTAGTIVLDDGAANHEEISYSGSSRAGGVMTLTGVQRCLSGAGFTWAANFPVTPLLVGSSAADYESEVVSKGTAGSASRELRKTVQR